MGTPLHEAFGRIGEPTRHERGFVESRVTREQIDHIAEEAVHLWKSDVGPYIEPLLPWYDGEPVDGEDLLYSLEDLALMLAPEGVEMSEDDVTHVFSVLRELYEGEQQLPEHLAIALLADAIDPARRDKPRLVAVSKELARDFVLATHSQLPELRAQGFLYAVGVAVGSRLAAVATVNTPSGAFKNPDRVVDLSRVASDGTVRGASSMLTARVIDLLPRTGRRGTLGTLLVTYSLLSEAGTTYLALADKGLRPTRYLPPHKASGSRRGAGADTALRQEGKIVWEAGPDAAPPNWALLDRTQATKAQIAGARKSFEAWQQREARRRPSTATKEASGERQPNPAKRPSDLGKPGDHVTLSVFWITMRVRIVHNGDEVASLMAHRQPSSKIFHVDHVSAKHGWGPLVYDVAMERATELGGGLAPDRGYVSPAARRVWDVYLKREDIEKTVHPDGPIGSRISKWIPAKFVFHAKPRTLSELRARPRFFTEDGDGERPGRRRVEARVRA